MVEEDLDERAAGGVADQDGRRVELADHRLEVRDYLWDRHPLNGGRVLVERLDLDLVAGVRRREHPVALALVVGDPVLPAARRDPEAVD